MRLALVGATGATGSRVLDLALAEGHRVRALVRREQPAREGVDWVLGDVLDPSSVARMATGTEAVIVALGPRSDSASDLCSKGTEVVIAACRAFRIDRLVVLTGAMIGHPPDKQSVVLRTIRTTYRIVQPAGAEDRDRQEALVLDSGLDFTIVRAPRIVDGDETDEVRVGADLFVSTRDRATRGDVARTLLDAAVDGDWSGLGVVVLSQ
jgi:putative NADH-flavin reductase